MVSSRTGCANYKQMGSKRPWQYAYTENPGWVYHAQIEACFGLVLIHQVPGGYNKKTCQQLPMTSYAGRMYTHRVLRIVCVRS